MKAAKRGAVGVAKVSDQLWSEFDRTSLPDRHQQHRPHRQLNSKTSARPTFMIQCFLHEGASEAPPRLGQPQRAQGLRCQGAPTETVARIHIARVEDVEQGAHSAGVAQQAEGLRGRVLTAPSRASEHPQDQVEVMRMPEGAKTSEEHVIVGVGRDG